MSSTATLELPKSTPSRERESARAREGETERESGREGGREGRRDGETERGRGRPRLVDGCTPRRHGSTDMQTVTIPRVKQTERQGETSFEGEKQKRGGKPLTVAPTP